eukprot:UN33397
MNPGLLFLDEPTTGLDSASARNVMASVRRLAKTRAVICTIHQPSEEIFETFDGVLLMQKGGRICYFGDRTNVVKFFESNGFPKYAEGTNVADYALDCASCEEAKLPKDFKTPADVFEATDAFKLLEKEVDDAGDEYKEEDHKIDLSSYPGFCTQFTTCLVRLWNDRVRNTPLMIARASTSLVMSLLMGWVYFDSENTQAGTQSKYSCMLIIMIVGVIGSLVLAVEIFNTRNFVFRERESKMYSPEAY